MGERYVLRDTDTVEFGGSTYDAKTAKRLFRYGEDAYAVRFIVKIVLLILVLVLVLVFSFRYVNPRITLYKASIEKRVQIEDAEARAEAAVLLADAEVERAKGVAEANRIIAQSITEEYIRWLYVDQLDTIEGQIIYIPTEAGIPILEARDGAPSNEGGG